MSRPTYLTAPLPSDRMPHGIPYIVGNEAAERFSFYGMKAILVVYMTKYLCDWSGRADHMAEEEAKFYMHAFVASAYFFPLAGAVLSDWLWGKYRTILALSLVYCIGHLALALVPGRMGLLAGLLLIAVGAGGIKPCVSAHVGDQFGAQNRHLLEKVFGWFYLSINLGAFLSTMLTPWLLESEWMLNKFGAQHTHELAFGVPGVLMFLATVVFWLGRNKFVHVPAGGTAFFREMLGQDGLAAMLRLIPLYCFVAVFWALYDQTGSAWVLQAEKMDRHMLWAGLSWDFPWITFGTQNVLSAAIQAVNPLLILIYVPLFAYIIYPVCGRVFTLTPLRKVAVGFFLTAAAFAVTAMVQNQIDRETNEIYLQLTKNISEDGDALVAVLKRLSLDEKEALQNLSRMSNRSSDELSKASISATVAKSLTWTMSAYWQLLAYMVLTAAEILVSITCLEFSYTQAPKRMKSLVMALYLLSVSFGNILTSGVNWVIQQPGFRDSLTGARYYWFFTGLMLVAAVSFIPYAMSYKPHDVVPE